MKLQQASLSPSLVNYQSRNYSCYRCCHSLSQNEVKEYRFNADCVSIRVKERMKKNLFFLCIIWTLLHPAEDWRGRGEFRTRVVEDIEREGRRKITISFLALFHLLLLFPPLMYYHSPSRAKINIDEQCLCTIHSFISFFFGPCWYHFQFYSSNCKYCQPLASLLPAMNAVPWSGLFLLACSWFSCVMIVIVE